MKVLSHFEDWDQRKRKLPDRQAAQDERVEKQRERVRKGKRERRPSLRGKGRPDTSLSPREAVFCGELLANGLKVNEAIGVAYPNIAKQNREAYGRTVKNRPHVKAYLAKVIESKLGEQMLTTERVLHHLATAMYLDPLDVFEPGDVDGVWEVKSLDDIPQPVRQCITKIKSKSRIHEESGDVEVYFELEFIDKTKAIDLAMKYLGLLRDAGVNLNVNGDHARIDFDDLCKRPRIENDLIEQRISGNGHPKIVDVKVDQNEC